MRVEERVDRLELDVDQSGLDQQQQVRPLLLQEQLCGVVQTYLAF
jgi:hypothetical protein